MPRHLRAAPAFAQRSGLELVVLVSAQRGVRPSRAVSRASDDAEAARVDNSSVVIAHGRGKDAVPAEPMRALGERFGLRFEAHEVGDANRPAHVGGEATWPCGGVSIP